MKFEFSAGGVVYRKEGGKIFILLGQHSGYKGWVFAKGLIGDHIKHEKKEETAVREVEEETGVKAEIVQQLTPITYWYQWEGERRKKTVYYFLMNYLSGDTKNHDWEMENVEWILLEEVEKRLTYASDKNVWREAKQIIESL